MTKTVITDSYTTSVTCDPTCRNIHAALESVANGARLVSAAIGPESITLIFEVREEK